MNLGPALTHLHEATADLRDELEAIAERHATDHDVFHIGRQLSRRCDELVTRLEPFLKTYGGSAAGDGEMADAWHAFAEGVRRWTATATSRTSKAGPLLLRDLRELEADAHACRTDWVIVHQGALAARDRGLVDASAFGMSEMERIERWLTTRIKEAAPLILSGG